MSTGVTTSLREKALRSLDSLPPFSPVLNRLLSTLADGDVSFGRLAAVIEKDTVLAGSVLKLVNSALYGRQGTVNSVTHAIAIMGVERLRNVGLSFSVSRMWRNIKTPPKFSIARFNLHSVATGILADKFAQFVSTSYPEGAFAAGLFHDIGLLLIAIAAPSQFQMITDAGAEAALTLENELFGCNHAELSAAALQRWNLPLPIQTAVRYHHTPDAADARTSEDQKFTLADLIHGADSTATHLGIGIDLTSPESERPESAPGLEHLELGPASAELLRDFEEEFTFLRSAA